MTYFVPFPSQKSKVQVPKQREDIIGGLPGHGAARFVLLSELPMVFFP
jgi:hypothetical protein